MQLYDDHATFLLPRPTWVNDNDVAYCLSCNNAFGPLNRRHHCRNCGNIFCHDCSNRKVPLPQLGYGTKAVRVCNGCFEVAYLVTYAIDEDHGVSTQVHGVRGLLELAEKDDEKDLHNMVAYGGVDALIWLLRSSKYTNIHHLSTSILAMLAEKESIRPVLITKWALAALLIIIRNYTFLETTRQSFNTRKPSSHSAPSSTTQSTSSQPSNEENMVTAAPQNIILEIVMNCTHVIYQLSRAGILSQKEIFADGVLESLLMLVSFNMQYLRLENFVLEGSPAIVHGDENTEQQLMNNINIVQSLAAKSISSISSLIPFQVSIIELIQKSEKLPSLLRSSNREVEKYMAKTIAYLSLRNEKYKPLLLAGDGASALVSVLVRLPLKLDKGIDDESRCRDLAYYLGRDIEAIRSEYKIEIEQQEVFNDSAVSHACCALANFATNNESQAVLLSQPHLLHYICNVPLVFSTKTEIHRHVARCIANFALYEENNEAMLGTRKKSGNMDGFNVLPTLLFLGKVAKPDIQRQVVRAIDNLSCNLTTKSSTKGTSVQWKQLFGDAYTYITKFLEDSHHGETDADTYKRAKNIIAREKLESVHADDEPEQATESVPDVPTSREPDNTKESNEEETDTKNVSLTGSSSQGTDSSVQAHSSAEDDDDTNKKSQKKSKNKKRTKKHK